MSDFEIIKADLEYTIYCNIGSLAAARGLTIVGNGFDGKESTYPISDSEFQKKMKQAKYISVRAGDMTFIHVPVGSDMYKKDKIAGLIGKIQTNKLIIVKPSKVKIRSVPEHVEVINGDHYLMNDWVKANTEKGRSIEVLTPEQWKTGIIYTDQYVEPSELPCIDVLTQEVVWSNAKLGDIIGMTGPSLSSNGYTSKYHRVTDGWKN